MEEIWKDIPTYEGFYKVSNLGRVKSLSRMVKHKDGGLKKVNGRILKPGLTKGYKIVVLSKEGKQRGRNVHQLVAMAFLNHVPDGHKLVVDHIDMDKQNNNVKNLQLTTQRENVSNTKKGCTSKYTGVHWYKNAWVSMIYIKNKYHYLGRFKTELEAHQAYKLKLKEL